jgi:hypothetical protein
MGGEPPKKKVKTDLRKSEEGVSLIKKRSL